MWRNIFAYCLRDFQSVKYPVFEYNGIVIEINTCEFSSQCAECQSCLHTYHDLLVNHSFPYETTPEKPFHP